MAYTPYYPGGWQSGESGGTPITPAALNNMEEGIGAALTPSDVVNKSFQFLLAASGSTSTWADAYAKLKNLSTYDVATFFATGNMASLLTGGKVTSTMKGTVAYNGSGTYDFFAFAGLGPYAYGWRVTTLTGSTAGTVGTVYQYTGTAV